MAKIQTNIKLKVYSSWDIKSIVITTILLGLLGLLFMTFYLPSCDSRERNKNYYNAETKGVIYSIDRKTGFTQGRTGNSETTLGYVIKFYYVIDGKRFDNTDFISQNSVPDNKFVNYVFNNLNTEVFTVRYVSFNPEESFIVKRLDDNK